MNIKTKSYLLHRYMINHKYNINKQNCKYYIKLVYTMVNYHIKISHSAYSSILF